MRIDLEKTTRDDLQESIKLLRVLAYQKPSRELRLAMQCAMRSLRWLNKATYTTIRWGLK